MRKYPLSLAVVATVAVLGLSACGAANQKNQGGAPPAANSSTTTADIKVVDTSTLGKIVTDAKGWTLYRFDKDTSSPAKSTCYGDCAKKWPPVAYVDGLKVEGVSLSLVGKVERTDGTVQLTLGGWPAYRYASDTRAGDTKGHGVSNTWFAFTPESKRAQTVITDNGGGGY
jgi:predicted lipoprotein with Yx(FWY)xxD motif